MGNVFDNQQVAYSESRVIAFWNQHYVLILAVLFLILLASVLITGYRILLDTQAEYSSLRYEALREEIRGMEPDEEMEKMEAFIADEPNAYGVLINYRRARSFYRQGQWQQAVEVLQSIANNGFLPLPTRDFGRLSAGYAMVDNLPSSEVAAWVADLLVTGHPMRIAASEIMGAAYFLEEDYLEARDYLQRVASSDMATEDMRKRANAMLGAVQRHLHPVKVSSSATSASGAQTALSYPQPRPPFSGEQ